MQTFLDLNSQAVESGYEFSYDSEGFFFEMLSDVDFYMSIDEITLVLKKGANINPKGCFHGKRWLHRLCDNKKIYLKLAELFFKHGAEVNAVDKDNKTPFHYLCLNKSINLELVEHLIQNGTDINAVNGDNTTSFCNICLNKSVSFGLIDSFLQNGIGPTMSSYGLPTIGLIMNENVSIEF